MLLYIFVPSSVFVFQTLVSENLALTRFLTLNMNIGLPCFGALGVWPRARTLPHMSALLIGSDYSYCLASEQFLLIGPGHP